MVTYSLNVPIMPIMPILDKKNNKYKFNLWFGVIYQI